MHHDLTRNTLAIVAILGLIGLSLWVLRPFLAATVWASMIVVATWPWLKGLQQFFGGRRGPAVTIMTVGMLLLLVLPMWWAISTIVERSDQLIELGKKVANNGLPQPPEWVKKIPLIGGQVDDAWTSFVAGGAQGLIEHVSPYAADTGKWVLAQFGGLGGMLIQFLLVVVVAAILYSSGEEAAAMARTFGRRLAGDRGENSMILAGRAIRSVALGVGVTAIVQSSLGGIGLVVAGVPYAAVFTAVMLMLCIAQLGPSLVLFPTVAWMYWSGNNGWATALLVWSLFVVSIDNFLRPVLIKRGADLPLLLIFAGVIGGMLSFGLIGIFVGPVALAVTYTLFQSWASEVE
ncbi:AI-2E family transporter YdiK [Orrella sp. NBD-18]|uniref:AI-2E family transporter YdiK n=1 Tax=Sheuella amnicola TaxID=2707330 RepID=A0A6B2QY17_9BURK|nr:AI-2E family transporter YdiK [Sheuella amnicola]NDY82911.1 AI-2E family transporter YdiK [Sheuella amnicola]